MLPEVLRSARLLVLLLTEHYAAPQNPSTIKCTQTKNRSSQHMISKESDMETQCGVRSVLWKWQSICEVKVRQKRREKKTEVAVT